MTTIFQRVWALGGRPTATKGVTKKRNWQREWRNAHRGVVHRLEPSVILSPPLSSQTDPENTDYTMEHGATRNFQAEKLLEEEEKRVQKEREDEELNNPMKVNPRPQCLHRVSFPISRL